VGRSASLYGVLGLVFLVFGFAGAALVGPADPYVLLNLVAAVGLLLAYLAFGLEHLREAIGQRSTRYGAGATVYSLLFIALLVGANYLGVRHHHRWDVTEAGVYTLAPQSKQVVEGLKDKLEITAFVEGGVNPQLQTLLESYHDAAPAQVQFRLVDPDKEPALVEQMKITTAPSVHLQYGKESYVVTQPTEENITNGIIRVSGGKKKVAYFTEGDGEASPEDREAKGYSNAKTALEQENYEVKTFILPAAEKVPDDASVVIVAGLGQPPTDHAVEVLDNYLKSGGHLLMLIGPRQGNAKLTSMLANWGVKLGDDIVVDREVRLFEGPRLGVVPITKTYGMHPITQNFRDFTIYPQTRTVEAAAEGKKGLQATVLAKTSATSWAETDLDDLFNKQIAKEDPQDRKGPLGVAVAVTAKLTDMGITPPANAEGKVPDEARLVVFGTPMFADNQELVQSRLNGDLFLNAVGWLVGQENLVSIRSRTVRASRAELTPRQAVQVFYLSVLIIPQLLIVAGIAVWWQRRSA
jgi:ABC-type uncharacterized transport system involved in gliding motility auxiliary subunit